MALNLMNGTCEKDAVARIRGLKTVVVLNLGLRFAPPQALRWHLLRRLSVELTIQPILLRPDFMVSSFAYAFWNNSAKLK